MKTVAALEHLHTQCPLPSGFTLTEVFHDVLALEGLSLHMVGIIATAPDGGMVMGSAADSDAHPWARAYYELVERAATHVARAAVDRTFPIVLAAGGEAVGHVPHATVFGDPDGASGTKPSMTNGVAVHTDLAEAARRATCELAERDGVLATWWGEAPVAPAALPASHPIIALEAHYDVEAFHLGDGGALGLPAAGVFAFPRHVQAPMVYGFDAHANAPEAVRGAADEALQRLAFLWGEEIPSVAPQPSASSEYHQELFLWPSQHAVLRNWLAGGHMERARPERGVAATTTCPAYVDLTPTELNGRVHVIKALSPHVRQLHFGPMTHRNRRVLPEGLRVHPIA